MAGFGEYYRGCAFPKGTPPVVQRIARHADRSKAEELFKQAVWTRDKGQCRSCGHHVQKANVNADFRGEVHHLVKRSQSKALKWIPSNGVLLCGTCHALVESGFIKQRGRTAATVTFSKRRITKERVG